MDGAGRFLRSLNRFGPATAQYGLAAPSVGYASRPAFAPSAPRFFPRARQRRRRDPLGGLARIARIPGLGAALTLAFLAAVLLYGAHRGGEYDAFVKTNGAPADLLARALGFRVDAVTMTGQIELSEAQILKAAGVDTRQSLLFLDPEQMRQRLLQQPLVKNANVRKFLPNRLSIEITERTPYAVWQKDGVVSIVAADGAPIDQFRDEKFARLPFVVGEGANTRVDEYNTLLEAAGELKSRVRAGILASQRRWTLKMDNGVEIMLPEADPAGALRKLARMESDGRILEKDIVLLDFRTPNRLYLRLTEEAASAREAAHAGHKGGH